MRLLKNRQALKLTRRMLAEEERPSSPVDDRLSRYRDDASLLMSDAGLTPDPWQAEFLRCTDKAILMLCARQVGKSQAVAAKALHVALTRPGSLVTIVAQRQDTAAETLRKAITTYYRIGQPVPVLNQGKTHFELTTGSRILALPGEEKAMHGPTADLLILDEAARIPDAAFNAASPQLSASGGTMIASSTAFAKSGWFFSEWEEGEGYHRFSITTNQCPRHSATFLRQEQRRMGPRWFQMAYYNVFGDAVDAVFRDEDIQAMFNHDRKIVPLFPPGDESYTDGKIKPLFG